MGSVRPHLRGGGGAYPIWPTGASTPFPGQNEGTPSQVKTGGYPIPGQDGGYPIPGQNRGVPPSQVRRGTQSQVRMGVPHPRSGWGGGGYPGYPQAGWGIPLFRCQVPYWNSMVCTCYAVGGMPLVLMQEDFSCLHSLFT